MNEIDAAKEAARLKSDAALQLAIDGVRADALEALAVADAGDMKQILRLQQTVAVCDGILDQFERLIIAAAVGSRGKRPVV